MYDRRLVRGVLAFILVFAMGAARLRSDERPAGTSVGRPIQDFELRDYYGKPRTLSELRESPVVVVAFLGCECPLARLYGPRLDALRRRFQDRGVAFLGVNSNVQDTLAELANFGRQHGISFPLLKDAGQQVAEQFGAKRTPEVFVLDRERVVRYAGRIDDQYGIGYQRPQPQHEDLAQAVEDLLAGRPVSVPETEVVGCFIGRSQRRQAQGEITYSQQIADILNRRCVECHRPGEIAPFPLQGYADVVGWGDTIAEVVHEERMPPWGANPEHGKFRNDGRLTPAEKQLLLQWIENGMPEGDPSSLPAPPTFAEGWRMPEPDQIIYMRDEPFVVPAEGVVEYQYFEVDPGFEEDKYIWAAQARPDNRSVVHHILVYVLPPGEKDFRQAGAIDGYAPGSQPRVLPDGLAMRVPARSRLVFEMHYTPNGRQQQDRSSVGLKFLDKSQVRNLVHGALALNEKFRIPAGSADYEVTAERELPQDVYLLNLTPHMHVRGKSFRYEAIYPGGNREILLDVPRYDFNWQLTYELEQPKLLPRGTRIFCTARFDNSPDNPVNPDPTRVVTWGDQSWEEMMIGFFDVLPVKGH